MEVKDVTYQSITELMDMYCSAESKTVILTYVARRMCFFGKMGLCPDSFAILLDRQIYPHVGRLGDFSVLNENKVVQMRGESNEFPAGEFRETIESFIETLEKHGYIGTTLHLARHSLTVLYLFLDIHALGYHSSIMWAWFSEISKGMERSWLHWRRILKCYEEYTSLDHIFSDGKYRYSPSSLESLP